MIKVHERINCEGIMVILNQFMLRAKENDTRQILYMSKQLNARGRFCIPHKSQ